MLRLLNNHLNVCSDCCINQLKCSSNGRVLCSCQCHTDFYNKKNKKIHSHIFFSNKKK